MSIETVRPLVIGGVALGVALVVGALAVERVLWFDLTVSTQGTVVDVDSSGEGVHTYTVRFSDADGREHLVRGWVIGGSARGHPADVWYDPNDPASAATPTGYVWWTVVMAIVAVGALSVAFSQAAKHVRRGRGSARPSG